eukprot:INCI5084.2.p1 GENE.INCI5084.2~~INCI5084.2.p1  ORF type:complete len:1256 (-),score=304.35 INCI5084.2:687-4454(-)
MDPGQSDVFHTQIQERLTKTKDDVAATLKLLMQFQDDIRKKYDDLGRSKPRDSEENLNQRIKDIEFEMMTSNLSKIEEENCIRRITKIRDEIRKLDAYKEIDALKYKAKVTQERLDLQRKAVKELTSGLRKLEVIRKIYRNTSKQISLQDVVEKDLALQDSVVGDFIGYKGQNIHQLEADHGVVLDYEARFKVVHICGSAEGVASAIEAIEEINTFESQTLEVDSTAARILHRGSTLKEAIEQKHRVRLDVPNSPRPGSQAALAAAGNKLKIIVRGPPSSVSAAAEDIQAFLDDVDEIKIPSNLTGFVVGPKGATIMELQQEHGIQIFIDRPSGRRSRNRNNGNDEDATCQLYGDASGRTAALKAIQAILDENRVHEEDAPLARSIAPYFIGPGGSRIQAFQKATGVFVKVHDDKDHVTLKGTRSQIDSAREALATVVETYNKEHVDRTVSRLEFNLVAGTSKESSQLRTLQKETGLRSLRGLAPYGNKPGRLLLAGPEEAVAAAQAAIDKILADVTAEEMKIHESQKRFVIGQKGKAISQVEKSSGAFLTLEDTTVRIVGVDAAVTDAREQIQAILDANSVGEVTIPSSYVGELIGAKGAGIAALHKAHRVRVDVPKSKRSSNEDVVVVVQGTKENVSAAVADIKETMEKYFKCNKIFHLHPNFARRVGQSSQKIIKAAGEADDSLKQAQIISIGRRRGNAGSGSGTENGGIMLRVVEEEDMPKLEAAISAEAGDFALRSSPDSPSATVKVVEGYTGVVIGRGGSEITRVESEFNVCVDVRKASSSVLIVGETEEAVAAARDDILARLRRTVKLDVTVEARQLQLERVLGGNLDAAFRRLQSQHGGPREVTVKTSPGSSKKQIAVHIKGTANAVQAIKSVIENAAQGRVTFVMDLLSADHARSLVENSADNLLKIRRDCGVSVDVDADGGASGCTVTISGERVAAAKAEKSVYHQLRFSFPGQYLRVSIPQSLAREIVRTRFEKLHELEEAHGVKIQLRDTYLSVLGPSVAEAEVGITQMVKDHKDLIVTMVVDSSMFGSIIGSKGATIRRIVEEAGGASVVQIDINREQSTVTIAGKTKEATAAAKAGIKAVIDEERARNMVFDIPPNSAGDIIGRGGATIRQIQESTGCRVNLQRDSNRCQITGPDPDEIAKARAQIEEILERVRADEEEREAQRTLRDTREGGFVPNGSHIAFPIADRDIPAVLGRGGATIRQLQEDTGCRINLSKDDGMCYITNGTEETRKEAQVRAEPL